MTASGGRPARSLVESNDGVEFRPVDAGERLAGDGAAVDLDGATTRTAEAPKVPGIERFEDGSAFPGRFYFGGSWTCTSQKSSMDWASRLKSSSVDGFCR